LDTASRAHGEAILASAREEIARADAKASILFASTGVVVGALVAALLAGSWNPSKLHSFATVFWWIGATLIAAALLCLGCCVYPRVSRRRNTGATTVAYYGDVWNLTVAQVRAGLVSALADPETALLDQLTQVSRVVWVKYQLIRMGLWLLLAGTIGVIFALAVEAIVA
jgi:hypothetical protein